MGDCFIRPRLPMRLGRRKGVGTAQRGRKSFFGIFGVHEPILAHWEELIRGNGTAQRGRKSFFGIFGVHEPILAHWEELIRGNADCCRVGAEVTNEGRN
jgi:hypothetical protein